MDPSAAEANDRWSLKYRKATQEHETDRHRWASLDALQRRLISRLCVAAEGLDGRLDGELARLTSALRQACSFEQLGPLAERVSRAVALLPERSGNAPTQIEPMGPGTISVELIELLNFSPAQQPRARNLRERLLRGATPGATDELAELIRLELAALLREKQAAEQLLAQVTSRLDEMAGYLTRESQSREAAALSGQQLDSELRSEMQAIDDSARTAASLQSLQEQVRKRLELIGGHLKSFQQGEAVRRKEYETDSARMRARIEELEKGAQALKRSAEEGKQLALTDVLTAVPNRLAYEQRLQQLLAAGDARPAAMLAVWDIDHFKRVNDTYGHQVGDKVLRIVAQLLTRQVRGDDFIARIGGEEFVMLLVGIEREEALKRVNQLRQLVEGVGFVARGTRVAVTVSCGVTPIQPEDTPESLFERADRALYAAKNNGRNRCEFA
ncbi:MAG: diguanylate cyclase [Sinimarinibacterium sp.]|jgi:diguanylate cyclase